jgi:RNA-directed DNA polymerase
MGLERRGLYRPVFIEQSTIQWEELLSRAKPYSISKRVVWEAYKRVKANKGAAGVDGESIAEYEEDLKNNLYKLWNRMSSGSYFPPPVREVEIQKYDGGKRPLGIPTVADRIAQAVVKLYLEPSVEPYFHPDSYGYRPGKSAIEAVGVARQRCWRYNWVVDLDIKGFFDNLDHKLVMRTVRKHTDCKWILLYIERWLKAPVQREKGELLDRDKGTPQGSVISPLLANLFLNYAFDEWMRKTYPSIPFERYADDIIVHCASERQAKWIKATIERRLLLCRLELHPEKTKIVYCKDDARVGSYRNEKFDFLGYTFRPRTSKTRLGKYRVSFSSAVSNKATKKMRQDMRGWRFHRRSDKCLEDFSRFSNPIVRGWINYYGRYYKSALYRTFDLFNCILVQWVMRKYKKFNGSFRRAKHWLGRLACRQPWLFAHWQFGCTLAAGR